MKCPICKEINLTMTERNGVEIDYCPQCRGVWLDRGELDKIIEKVNGENKMTTSNSNQFVQAPQSYDQQSYYKHKRKKSFLEELFD